MSTHISEITKTQMSIGGWMDVIYPDNGIMVINKKKQTPDMCYNLGT